MKLSGVELTGNELSWPSFGQILTNVRFLLNFEVDAFSLYSVCRIWANFTTSLFLLGCQALQKFKLYVPCDEIYLC